MGVEGGGVGAGYHMVCVASYSISKYGKETHVRKCFEYLEYINELHNRRPEISRYICCLHMTLKEKINGEGNM